MACILIFTDALAAFSTSFSSFYLFFPFFFSTPGLSLSALIPVQCFLFPWWWHRVSNFLSCIVFSHFRASCRLGCPITGFFCSCQTLRQRLQPVPWEEMSHSLILQEGVKVARIFGKREKKALMRREKKHLLRSLHVYHSTLKSWVVCISQDSNRKTNDRT